MRIRRSACTFSLLVALALHPCAASAQQPMSAQDDAIHREMIKTMGADPAAVMAASKRWMPPASGPTPGVA